jgi:hypothetical protein
MEIVSIAEEPNDSPDACKKQLNKLNRSFAHDATSGAKPIETGSTLHAMQETLEQVGSTNCQ